MESKKNGNPAKLVAFFLVVTVLIAAIAFSASGWQGDALGKPDSGNSDADGDESENGDADENKDGEGNGEETPVTPVTPIYTHYVSGLEITKEESLLKPLCIVFDTEAPMYGISSSFLTVEIPTEDGKTRLLAFSNDATSKGKLGSIAPTRKYISNIAGYFGAVLVSAGEDDKFEYSGVNNLDTHIDFTSESGYHYTEYARYSYTNEALLNAYIKNNGVSTVRDTDIRVPYVFKAESSEIKANESEGTAADTVLISFDKGSTTELFFSDANGKYRMKKNSSSVTDRLNDMELLYDNIFILYGDSITHETMDATQLIFDTVSGGVGYYATGGKAVKINWSTNDAGEMIFTDEGGEVLAVNPGTSYIAFAKASQMSNTKLS